MEKSDWCKLYSPFYCPLFGICVDLFYSWFQCCRDCWTLIEKTSCVIFSSPPGLIGLHLKALWLDSDARLEAVSIMLTSFLSTERTEGDFLKTVLSQSAVVSQYAAA